MNLSPTRFFSQAGTLTTEVSIPNSLFCSNNLKALKIGFHYLLPSLLTSLVCSLFCQILCFVQQFKSFKDWFSLFASVIINFIICFRSSFCSNRSSLVIILTALEKALTLSLAYCSNCIMNSSWTVKC